MKAGVCGEKEIKFEVKIRFHPIYFQSHFFFFNLASCDNYFVRFAGFQAIHLQIMLSCVQTPLFSLDLHLTWYTRRPCHGVVLRFFFKTKLFTCTLNLIYWFICSYLHLYWNVLSSRSLLSGRAFLLVFLFLLDFNYEAEAVKRTCTATADKQSRSVVFSPLAFINTLSLSTPTSCISRTLSFFSNSFSPFSDTKTDGCFQGYRLIMVPACFFFSKDNS